MDPNDLEIAFHRLWNSDSWPDLDAFLASSGPVNSVQLGALVRTDQALRWERGDRRLTETYLARYPAILSDGDNAVDLIYHEYLLRERHGEPASVEDFARRFPQFAMELSQQVELHRLILAHSTTGSELRCPVCQNTIKRREGIAAELACEVCGSNYRIQRDDAVDLCPDLPTFDLGKYKLVLPIGAGAFGTVYKAHDVELDRVGRELQSGRSAFRIRWRGYDGSDLGCYARSACGAS